MAEQCALGGMLLRKDVIADVVEILHPRDLLFAAHQLIYDAVLGLYGPGEPVNVDTVASYLAARGNLEAVGGTTYLESLATNVPTTSNTAYYAEVVVEKALLRRLATAGRELSELASQADANDSVDFDDVLRRARSLVAEFAADPSEEDLPELSEILLPALDQIDAIAGTGVSPFAVRTGFTDLDELTGGFAHGSLVVIGAHPGVGASNLALDIARFAAVREEVPTAYLSLDNPAEAITQRLLCAEARIRLSDMRSGRMSDADWTRLAQRTTEISEKPIVISQVRDAELAAVTKSITELVAYRKVRLVVIDSLHLVSARRDLPYENREREVAEVARRLKRLALDTGIVIVATVQLSTNPGPRVPVPSRPSLADLRDSGSIAHVADYVLFVQRPDAWERDDPRAGEADLILAKHKHGPTATVVVAHQLHYCRFANLLGAPPPQL
ncbi:replicative DNA helicase [Lentzea sp. NPDC102401]|uniref:replicative DNA helicase n=1 Tax=Lentzea sp. NPDC102401 TaxID=3364128 RepID=UPI003812198B